MQWADILNDRSLQDLPYKIELNGWGQIVMSPASNRHSGYQGQILRLIYLQMTSGNAFPESALETTDGVKVPDVVWMSDDFFARHAYSTPYPEAPELCVEVLSPSNRPEEIAHKIALFFEQHAQEVWTCSESGMIRFYDSDGAMHRSKLFPQFPDQI
ncbi:MAG: Uma2 family endonuclease [Planctomycetaceae bacterium]|nr:Uma2 family endonuclease [Planctomycetaceae bacterium]